MTATAFSTALDTLELKQTAFAALADLNPRTVRGYVSGEDAVPRRVQLLLEAWLLIRTLKRGHWTPAELAA